MFFHNLQIVAGFVWGIGSLLFAGVTLIIIFIDTVEDERLSVRQRVVALLGSLVLLTFGLAIVSILPGTL